ncbi:hypothetical protein WN944_015522 [Citrus x changshan-huyou]|uniref:TIR domain-containing protein n=1 Tax=Citrus x changshan-huyou TaxID=2935761 RepID=A0AAP0ME59_9ROSI
MSKVKEIGLNPNTFTKMRKFRFLKFYSSSFNGENKCKVSYLQDPRFTEVKYLHWHGYPLKSLPSNIGAEKLVFLEMPNSSIEQLWDDMKHRGKLNPTIHAAYKMLIAKTPNPTLIPHLNKLVILNLRGSKSLKSLPAGIFNLEFLTTLDQSGCSKLKRLPEISSSNTSCLFLSGTAIEELPLSIELLLRLEYLDLSDCKRLKSLPSSLLQSTCNSPNRKKTYNFPFINSSAHFPSSLALTFKHDYQTLGFGGEDTRDNFTSHLYSALSRQNIQTFIDDQLNRGDEISESLVNAIEASAISVIVFSESYASSRWCLDELVKILDCKEYAQIVIPVFYRVDPSDVRNQTGSFGDSFSKLEERLKENTEKLQSWRNALEEAASVESKDVYALGIWGIGGIGKTAIARAIFDKISEKIEGICLDMSKIKEIHLNPNTFAKMRKLRFLKFYSSSFNGENKCKVSHLQDLRFAEVKYLHWHGYPLKSLPSNHSAEKLVFLEVPNSDIEQLWNGVKQHYSKLNQLIQAACKKLIAKTLNPTLIPHLNKLVILNLSGSKSLKFLPARIFNLEFLTELDLSGCSKLKRLPEISSGNIGRLFLSGTAIEELPSSFELLLRLWLLDLSDCKRLKSLPSSLCEY